MVLLASDHFQGHFKRVWKDVLVKDVWKSEDQVSYLWNTEHHSELCVRSSGDSEVESGRGGGACKCDRQGSGPNLVV